MIARHRLCPTSTESQSRLVCGAPAFVQGRHARWVGRWADVTCRACLERKPDVGTAAKGASLRVHYQYRVAGIAPRIACGELPVDPTTPSSDPSDVTCGRCLRSVAMAPWRPKAAR